MGYTPSFTPQYENGWENLPIEETPITAEALNAYDDAIENIEDYLASDESQANLADAYDETETYAVGDYVIYGGDLYKCTTAISTAEEWDSTHWTPCLITDEMGSGSGGSTVTITPTLSTGTKIADFEIDGVEGELYAPTGGGGSSLDLLFPNDNDEHQIGENLYIKRYTGTLASTQNTPADANFTHTLVSAYGTAGKGNDIYNIGAYFSNTYFASVVKLSNSLNVCVGSAFYGGSYTIWAVYTKTS